jgi:hypothetical protein
MTEVVRTLIYLLCIEHLMVLGLGTLSNVKFVMTYFRLLSPKILAKKFYI